MVSPFEKMMSPIDPLAFLGYSLALFLFDTKDEEKDDKISQTPLLIGFLKR